MKIFILEDDLTRIGLMLEAINDVHEVTIARDMNEVPLVFNPPYDVMFLDHDLGNRQMVDPADANTGTNFVLRFCAGDDPKSHVAKHIFVHSYNPAGAKAMVLLLTERKYSVNYTPFGLSLLNGMKSL